MTLPGFNAENSIGRTIPRLTQRTNMWDGWRGASRQAFL